MHIVGLLEKAEGLEFFESWLKKMFGSLAFTPIFAVDHTHRVPARPPLPGAPQTPFLVKLLHFKGRDIILHKARDMNDLSYEGSSDANDPIQALLISELEKEAPMSLEGEQFGCAKGKLTFSLITYSMAESFKACSI